MNKDEQDLFIERLYGFINKLNEMIAPVKVAGKATGRARKVLPRFTWGAAKEGLGTGINLELYVPQLDEIINFQYVLEKEYDGSFNLGVMECTILAEKINTLFRHSNKGIII